jgi:segregation and condensation protein B
MNGFEKDTQDVEEIISLQPISEASISDVVAADKKSVIVSDNNQILPIPQDFCISAAIECMLFVSDGPIATETIANYLNIDTDEVQKALEELEIKYEQSSGLQIARIAGGYQVCTKPEYSPYCELIIQPSQKKLSKAALETLAVIAYRQPCTVPEVEAVRGVDVGGLVRNLAERGLIKEAGKKQVPGRPTIYITTPEFLEYFGLDNIAELPEIEMLAVEQVKALESQKEMFE